MARQGRVPSPTADNKYRIIQNVHELNTGGSSKTGEAEPEA